MSVYGMTTTGFQAEPATVTVANLDQSFKGVYGESIGSNPDGSIPAATSIGQEVAIITDGISTLWQELSAVVADLDPNQAVTPFLQVLCALTGTMQKPATASSTQVTCLGTVGTVLPVGRVVTVIGTNTRFASDAPATLVAVSATWATNTTYGLNALVVANGIIWQCTIAGLSANAGSGPSVTVADNTATWQISGMVTATTTGASWAQSTAYMSGQIVLANGWTWRCTISGTSANTGTGPSGYQQDNTVQWAVCNVATMGVAIVDYTAETTGPFAALPLQLQQIATPINGWSQAFNPSAAAIGQSLESDAALRARRVLELQAQGGGPPNAIRAAILAIVGVEDCSVFVNSTDAAVDGVPAHGVEVLILAPLTTPTDNDQLALAVFNAVGAGIATGGNISITITDDSGGSQTVLFTRPTAVPIFVSSHVYYDATAWASSSDVVNACTAALLNFALAYQVSEDVRSSPIASAMLSGIYAVNSDGTPIVPAPAGSPRIQGVLEVRNGAGTDGTLPYIGKTITPVTSTAITIAKREIATITVANIANLVITASSEAP